MKKSPTCYSLVLHALCLFFFLLPASCAKNQTDRTCSETDRKLLKDGPDAFILPVNLSPYGFLNGAFPLTKGSDGDTPYMPPVDSLIDRTKTKQISNLDGIVYTQVPFKSNETRCMSSFSGNLKTLGESVTPLKCFYISMENCFEQSEEEFIVTMIPSAFQVTSDPGYDFLDKPNYDGIILYSRTDGTYLRTRIYSRGLIEEGRMLSEESDMTDKTYIGFYQLVMLRTKTESIKEDSLISLYVTAGKPPRPFIKRDHAHIDIPLPHVSEIERPPVGGGDPADNGSSPDMECTLVVRQGGCHQNTTVWKCEKGSSIIIKASSSSPECIFLCWTENDLLLSNRSSVSIKMDKDRSVSARYVSPADGGCYKLAQFATDTTLMKEIEGIRGKTGNTNKEHSTSKRANGTYYRIVGE